MDLIVMDGRPCVSCCHLMYEQTLRGKIATDISEKNSLLIIFSSLYFFLLNSFSGKNGLFSNFVSFFNFIFIASFYVFSLMVEKKKLFSDEMNFCGRGFIFQKFAASNVSLSC